MSDFSELLNRFVRGRGVSVTQLARSCGIHPPTLHQYMNGKRALHNDAELESLSAALQLTPAEYEQLSEAYSVLQLGPERSAERRKIRWLLRSLPEIERRYGSVGVTPEFHPYEISHDCAVLRSETEIQAVLFSLFADALQRGEELAVMLPPENELLYNLFLLLGHFPSESVIRHVICMESGRCTGKITNIERAYYVVQYSTSVARYTAGYYYGHPDERFGNESLMPGLILTENSALRLSPDCRTAILFRNPEILRCYREQFQRVEQLCRPLLTHQVTPLSLSTHHNDVLQTDTILPLSRLISGGLCASAFLTDEIIREYLNPEIPNCQEVLASLLELTRTVQAYKRARKTVIILNQESVRSFAQTGYLTEYPRLFMAKPLSKAHRRILLEKMLQACAEGWYQMIFLKNCVFPVKPHWDVGIMFRNILSISVVSDTLSRDLRFNEQGVCRAFEDYFDDLSTGRYAVSPEETNAAIRQIIDELLPC